MLRLPYSFVVALPVAHNELLDFTDQDWKRFSNAGLQQIDLDAAQVGRAITHRSKNAKLTAEDCFSLVLAEDITDSILLTGEAELRSVAIAVGCEVHGVIWVIDEISGEGLLANAELAQVLSTWLDDPLVRLLSALLTARLRNLVKSNGVFSSVRRRSTELRRLRSDNVSIRFCRESCDHDKIVSLENANPANCASTAVVRETAMEKRIFGRTGLELSVLGLGCGAVGGLMVRGDPLDQERTIARAIDAGVNYFDTAVQYGGGESEKNLGRILQKLKPADAVVGTKVRLPSAEFDHIADAVATSLDGSLARLRRDRVEIFHLHNVITEAGGGETLSVQQVLDEVVPAFERLRQQGKTRFLGLTAIGDLAALYQVIDAGAFDSAQVVYNMLNPSAGAELPPNYPAQDYGRLFDHTRKAGVGVIGIRVLAGGALSGSTERHPIASPPPEPIGSAMSYEADVTRARRLMSIVQEGYAASLTEAATRFVISQKAVGTILVGIAAQHQFENAIAAVEKGPLPPAALDRLSTLLQIFSGEPR